MSLCLVNCLSKRGFKIILPVNNLNIIRNSHTTSNVDKAEVEYFKKFTAEWWDEQGPLKPLHSMNKVRIPFIRDGLVNSGIIPRAQLESPAPLQGLNILDVGCGGGILSESLARLGGNVTGLDVTGELTTKATQHAELENLKNIIYINSTVEEHCVQNPEKYDAVVASEVVEHVSNKEGFLHSCVKCIKPRGSIFITTINKTRVAQVSGIYVAEYLLRLVPRGTHQYEKFIQPHDIQRILESVNCRTELIHGLFYNFLANKWMWTSNTSVNYALHAVKLHS